MDIVLVSCDEEAEGFSRGKLVRVVREITGLGIKDGKALVESAPSVICNGVSRVEAAALRQKLESVGALWCYVQPMVTNKFKLPDVPVVCVDISVSGTTRYRL